jgi:PAS domain S-box-containing protein
LGESSVSCNRFEDLIVHFPTLVRIADCDKNAIWFNDEWLNFRGRTLEEECGRGWMAGVHPDDLQPLLTLFVEKFDARLAFETKYRVANAAGEYRWLLHRSAPRIGDAGEFLGFISTCVDVHDAALSDYDNARFFDIATDLLLTTKPDGSIGKINAAVERILGWTPQEFITLSYTDVVHPDDLAATVALKEPLHRCEDILDFENRYRHKDGSYRWLSWRCRYDPATGVTYASAVDINDRKRYEKELEDAVNRFNLAISATSEGVYEYDFEAGSFYVSPRFKEQLGFAKDEGPIDVNDWIAMVHPEDVEATLAEHRKYLEGQVPELKVVFRMRHQGGDWRTIMSRAVVLRHDDGRPCRLIGMHADITERQRHEDDLRRLKEEAESANRAKSDFLANMSHEIRTPMNAVLGAAHILGRGSLSADKQDKALAVLVQSANSLMDLINDLLDLSKIEARSLDLEASPFDARALVSEVAATLELQAGSKGLSLQQQNRCACVGERLFLGDRVRIKQIIMNLVANAVKFTDKGTITLAVDCVPTDQPDIEELRFYVSDTGIGIAADKLGAIFGKFEQGDTSIGRRFGGSGLGLSIAKALAEAMGGSISAESELGIGSTFVVRLQLQRAGDTRQAEQQGSNRPSSRRAHILLVEDNPANVMIATHFLDEFGYTFEVATTGLQAVEKVKSGELFDAILMDIQMPGMDGRQATREIRAFERQSGLQRTPIIAMTAHALLHDRTQCLEAGMDDYIAKPFDPATLGQKLRTLFSSAIATASKAK